MKETSPPVVAMQTKAVGNEGEVRVWSEKSVECPKFLRFFFFEISHNTSYRDVESPTPRDCHEKRAYFSCATVRLSNELLNHPFTMLSM